MADPYSNWIIFLGAENCWSGSLVSIYGRIVLGLCRLAVILQPGYR